MLKLNGIAIIKLIKAIIKAVFFRLLFNCVIKDSTDPSNIFTAELKAAKIMLKKKKIASILPAGIFSKIVGTVTNNNYGPAAGSNPKANAAGIITKAANNAAAESNIAVVNAILGISNSFFI